MVCMGRSRSSTDPEVTGAVGLRAYAHVIEPRLLRVMVVDTYIAQASDIRQFLEHEVGRDLVPGFVAAFDVVQDGVEALALAHGVPYDAIFLSESLHGITAEELVSDLFQIGSDAFMVMIVGAQCVRSDSISAAGFTATLLRPVTGSKIADALRALYSPQGLSSHSPRSTESFMRKNPPVDMSSPFTSLTRSARADRVETLIPPARDLPDWTHFTPRISDIDESYHSLSGDATSFWRPPQILSMAISETLGHLLLQGGKKVKSENRGWRKKGKKMAT